jgi:hypothetical protein
MWQLELVATRFNPARKAFSARLLAAGTGQPVAEMACRHTLWPSMNAAVRDMIPRQPREVFIA